jgi:endonuclease/exonuclease/phosphatase family metal-dependent hydrolase
MQWNAWYQEDIDNVVKLIREHQPDIVCLQELTIGFPGRAVKDTPAYLAEQLGYNYYHKELPIESTDGSKIMLANGIFSRFPISDQRFAWINQPKAGGGYSDEYRAYVEVTLDISGRPLSVGTTHMSYTHAFQDTEGKRAETDLLLDQLRNHGDRFVFTGDLNAIPGSYTIQQISQLLQDAGPGHDQKTWTTKPFSYNGFEEAELNWRLDYIFATKDVRVESSEIISTDYSDHLPIIARISL